jgi:hypothetical protein
MLRRSGTCMVPNCTSDARNYLGLRLRKPSTRAVWAPNADAFLCKTHAEHGGKFRITYDPGTSGMVEVEVALRRARDHYPNNADPQACRLAALTRFN